MQTTYYISPLSKFLFNSTQSSWIWLIVRIYVGWEWLSAGWGKFQDPIWIGDNAGRALSGFVQGALTKTSGAHPDVQAWYASFLTHIVFPHASLWAYFVTFGEILVGLGLILGALTGIAAFFGLFMNLNYLLAGTVSVNPILFTLSILLVLAWRVAGHIGLDRYILPYTGTPWQRGKLFDKK